MGAKKKKGKAKKKKEKKEKGSDDEEEQGKIEINLPQYGWIRIELRLCDPPVAKYNSFKVVMRSHDRILELKKRIIDFHGCVDDIHIFNKDPYPPRDKKDDYRMTIKPRVPPFR